MNGVHKPASAPGGREHIVRLRDFLDLPLDTFKDDQLTFLLGDRRSVIVWYSDAGYVTLLCEIGSLDALSADDWRSLLLNISQSYDQTFPVSLLTANGQVALAWTCPVSMHPEAWISRAEDAVTKAYQLQAQLAPPVLAG